MKMLYRLSFFLAVTFSLVRSQDQFTEYHDQTSLSLASSGAMKYGLYGYDNPALLTYIDNPDILLVWNDGGKKWSDFDRWGIFSALPNVGFGLINQPIGGIRVTDYKFSLAAGDRDASVGLGYGWSTGESGYFARPNLLTAGALFRPLRHLSAGVVGSIATRGPWRQAVVDISLRPLGNEVIALFGDGAIQHGENLRNASWSVGAALEALPGMRITCRYFDDKHFTLGYQINFGNLGLLTQSHYGNDAKYATQSYGLRLGAYDRTVWGTSVMPVRKFVEYNLNGPIRYQRFKWFDKSNTLSNLLATIQAAKVDPNVDGIAINASGMIADREILWEIREELASFKSAGKRIVIFVDRPNIDIYHFASVADKIVLDPTGTVMLEGYLMGRTFLRGTLEKLGIGYDEWRFFKYKSAAENLSRDKMSEADREQRQKIVDDYYKLARSEICAARQIPPDRFDRLVDEKMMFLPQDAIAENLVDTLGRWEIIPELIKTFGKDDQSLVNPGDIAKFNSPSDGYWGEKPRIAIVYALGACAMDEGISARSLSKVIEAVANDTKVKGVVLRVDSPGGDAMASDYVAEALKKCKTKKPVIVSQGYVAASGGYWLSMYADTIVAAPNTITGSIGVIGGWIYNKGLKDTLGMTTDHVKAGRHADIGFGFTLPFIGAGIPDRNLTPEEYAGMERMIRTMYKEFVSKVAAGRGKSIAEIEEIAQGRVWSGYDGKQIGLVDVLGGISTAISIAKEKSGISRDAEVNIVEYPEKGLFDIGSLMPKLLPLSLTDDPVIEHLRFRLRHNGQPMPLLPIEETEIINFK